MGRKRQVWTWQALRRMLTEGEGGHLLWPGAVDTDGYGYTQHDGARWRAHMLAYHLGRGTVHEGVLVVNDCGERLCCNPEHYHLASRAGFLADLRDEGVAPDIREVAWTKGRRRKGVREEGDGYDLSASSRLEEG